VDAVRGQGKLHGLEAEPLPASFVADARGLELSSGVERMKLDWKWLTIARGGGRRDPVWIVMAEHHGRTLRLFVSEPEDLGRRLLGLPLPQLLAQQVRQAERKTAARGCGAKLALIGGLVALGLAAALGPPLLSFLPVAARSADPVAGSQAVSAPDSFDPRIPP
jgi:hypothetical protein